MNSMLLCLIGMVLVVNFRSCQMLDQYLPLELDEDISGGIEQILKDSSFGHDAFDNQVDTFEIKKKPSWAVGRALDKRIIEFKRSTQNRDLRDFDKIREFLRMRFLAREQARHTN